MNSAKLVYPARMVLNRILRNQGLPKEWRTVLGDCNFSSIASGRTGSGKDAFTQAIMDNDLLHNRTVVIMDTKMEYPLNIFCQRDQTLANVLRRHGLVGRGYKVNLWIPYTQGLNKNQHFRELMQFSHPNLRIRPFRIYKPGLISEDSANMAMNKSQLQSMADKNMELKGQTKQLNELREHMAKMKMAFDDEDIWEPGCGWEYIDFDTMTNNKQVNVISTFFMMNQNVVAATSFLIGLLNELMTIGKSAHRYRTKDEMFSVVIPEVQIILPKRVKALEDIVNTLKYSMLVGLLLMRSFGVRLRINLQNLSHLESSMLSQSRIFVGKTWNVKDLSVLGQFGISKQDRIRFTRLKTGDFVDLMQRRKFNVVPMSHKAREQESLRQMLELYAHHPSQFLFETRDAFLSEIVDYPLIFDNKPLTIKEYERRVRHWLKMQRQNVQIPADIPEQNPSDIENLADMDEAEGAT